MTREEMSQDERGEEESREEEEVDGREATPASRGPKAGARLKAARQGRNISLDEIARELHLDVDKLRALEANRFEVFSAPVFSKGYLRRYAGLVGVSEDEVLAGFDELSDVAGPPPVVIKPSQVARPRYAPSLQAVLLVLLAVLLGLLGWWAFSGAVLKPVPEVAGDGAGEPLLPARDEDAPAGGTTVVGAVPPSPAEATTGTVDEAADDGAADPAPATVESTPSAGAAVGADAEPPPADTAELALTLSFTDECWLQVTDGDGERLYAGIARGGQVRRFSAVPPVSLVLGNADAVSIEVDGEPYPIGPADRRGRTARITVPGS
ncbi:helix-turn-helix domain-containing protein [Lentisalinibacter sediminis]|uniref:helix-turn-helix domain-containing protein n=1 Tax=Lentisalinibacter sediminis TaxID=2992237 RepID=UPI003863C83D